MEDHTGHAILYIEAIRSVPAATIAVRELVSISLTASTMSLTGAFKAQDGMKPSRELVEKPTSMPAAHLGHWRMGCDTPSPRRSAIPMVRVGGLVLDPGLRTTHVASTS